MADHRPTNELARRLVLIITIGIGSWLSPTNAQEVLRNKDEETAQPDRLLLPFAFYNETIGTAFGATYAGRGLLQPQSRFWATAIAADSGTKFAFAGIEDLQVPNLERGFMEFRLAGGEFNEIDAYVDGNPDFADETAGSNDSTAENFVKSEGSDDGFDIGFSYLLPIGAGRDQTTIDVELDNGLVSGGGRAPSSWNPSNSGLTTVNLNAIYRSQDTQNQFGENDLTTAYLKLSLEHDNTDFSVNPSRGSRQSLSIAHDWGALDSTDSWTTIDFELSKYVSLANSSRSRQRILAFNAWLIDTPSWDDNDGAISGRPPFYAGASLGGLRRLRGYPEGRFNGRSAVYYTAEYRHIPEWNRIADWSLLRRLGVDLDWLQAVAFVEAGRVADEFDISELHKDMKWSGGAGIRAFANHLVVRAEFATSSEESIFVMSINQPF